MSAFLSKNNNYEGHLLCRCRQWKAGSRLTFLYEYHAGAFFHWLRGLRVIPWPLLPDLVFDPPYDRDPCRSARVLKSSFWFLIRNRNRNSGIFLRSPFVFCRSEQMYQTVVGGACYQGVQKDPVMSNKRASELPREIFVNLRGFGVY